MKHDFNGPSPLILILSFAFLGGSCARNNDSSQASVKGSLLSGVILSRSVNHGVDGSGNATIELDGSFLPSGNTVLATCDGVSITPTINAENVSRIQII